MKRKIKLNTIIVEFDVKKEITYELMINGKKIDKVTPEIITIGTERLVSPIIQNYEEFYNVALMPFWYEFGYNVFDFGTYREQVFPMQAKFTITNASDKTFLIHSLNINAKVLGITITPPSQVSSHVSDVNVPDFSFLQVGSGGSFVMESEYEDFVFNLAPNTSYDVYLYFLTTIHKRTFKLPSIGLA